MLFFVLALAVFAELGSAITLDDCPASIPRDQYLQVYGDSCFEFVLYRRRHYDEAEIDCESRGGTLALVKTQDIQDYLMRELKQTYMFTSQFEVWIGLHDKDFERSFVWEDGTPLSGYSNWADNEGPTGDFNNDQHDCVSMSPTHGGQWYDHVCGDQVLISVGPNEYYICQYQIGGATAATIPPVSTMPPTTMPPTTMPPTTMPPTTMPPTTMPPTTMPPTTDAVTTPPPALLSTADSMTSTTA